MIWWEILLIIPILITIITLIIFLIFVIKDLKTDYKILTKLKYIAEEIEKKEKLMKEIYYEKSQLIYCYIKLNQITNRLDELMMKIEDGDFDND